MSGSTKPPQQGSLPHTSAQGAFFLAPAKIESPGPFGGAAKLRVRLDPPFPRPYPQLCTCTGLLALDTLDLLFVVWLDPVLRPWQDAARIALAPEQNALQLPSVAASILDRRTHASLVLHVSSSSLLHVVGALGDPYRDAAACELCRRLQPRHALLPCTLRTEHLLLTLPPWSP